MNNLEKISENIFEDFYFSELVILINPLKALELSPYADGPLLEIITQMPEGTWKKSMQILFQRSGHRLN